MKKKTIFFNFESSFKTEPLEIVVYQNEQTKISLLIVQLFLELSTTSHRSEFAHAAADGVNILEIFFK